VSLNLGDESVLVLTTSLEAAITPKHLLHETHRTTVEKSG